HILHPRSDITDPSGSDFVLNIPVIPRKTGVGPGRNECARGLRWTGYSAGSEKEPLRICEKRERGRAEGISRDHVQRLFLNWICQRDGDPVLNQSCVGIEPLKLRAFTL